MGVGDATVGTGGGSSSRMSAIHSPGSSSAVHPLTASNGSQTETQTSRSSPNGFCRASSNSEAALSTNHHGQLVVSLIKQGEILAEYVFGSEETMLLKEMLSHTEVDLSQV